MGTTADKLLAISNSKVAIRDAIVAKGVTVPVGTVLSDYATKIGEITTGGGGSEIADAWVRPSQWLDLPNNVDGVQKVSILNAVFDTDSELVAFRINGACTVDWGDGVVENFAVNATAEHKYAYSDVDLNSDTVATFGYKQCIITITPQSGQSITQISLQTYHSSIGSGTSYDLTSGFLDIRINALPCINLSIGSNSAYIKHTMLEQCLIGESGDTTFDTLFYDCYALQSVTIKDTSNVTSFANMHYNNYALQKMPTYTFRSAGVDVSSMFANCYSLRETYPIILQALTLSTSVNSTFSGCKSLKYIDLSIASSINYTLAGLCAGCLSLEEFKLTQTGTGKVTSLVNAFIYTRIKESPIMDTSLCTTFANAFQYCDRLTDLYEYNYSSATTLANMLDGCYSLKSVPNFNITASCTNLSALCNNCWSLEKAPTFSNSSGVTSIIGMLATCKSLTTIPNYTFGNISGTSLGIFVNACDSLQIMPSITVGSSYTANSNILNNCYSLKRMLMPLRFTFSVANAKMSATALNEMYSILPTVTGQTVTVTGNYGATDTPVVSLSGTSNGTKVVTMASTAGLSVGMFISGAGTATTEGLSTTTYEATDSFSNTVLGFTGGEIVSFINVVGITGITAKTLYYVVNANASTFQISLVPNGPIVNFEGISSVYTVSPSFITEIVPNVSITLSVRQTSFETRTNTYRSNEHKTYIATMKGWTVTG